MDGLGGLSWADGDGLREVDVERRAPGEEPGGGTEDQGMLQELAGRGAAKASATILTEQKRKRN